MYHPEKKLVRRIHFLNSEARASDVMTRTRLRQTNWNGG